MRSVTLMLTLASAATCPGAAAAAHHQQRQRQQQQPDVSGTLQEHAVDAQIPEGRRFELPDDVHVTEDFARRHIKYMHDKYPADQLLGPGLKNIGALTDRQLERLFRRCVTAGSILNVGALGGSITAGGRIVAAPTSYMRHLADLLQAMCPRAAVALFNGARGAQGSLTLGMCARTLMAPQLDLAVSEFALNDQVDYAAARGGDGDGDGGAVSNLPYELLTRNVLSYDPPPALLGVYFWGRSVTHATAQGAHEEVARRYGVTSLSVRDIVWPYFAAQRAPFADKADFCVDYHHPTVAVHVYTAELLALHLSERFLEWAERAGGSEGVGASVGDERPPLPAPLNAQLEVYDLERAPMQCSIAGSGEGPLGAMRNVTGWQQIRLLPACIQVSDMAHASGLLPISTAQGIVVLSNCPRGPDSRDAVPAFGVNLVEADGQRRGLRLVSVMAGALDGNAEAFRVDPLLEPGSQLLEIVANPGCTPKFNHKCDGLYAVTWL